MDRGLRVVILEKRFDSSGVWSIENGIANVGSQLQSDYLIYKDVSDNATYSKLYPPLAEIENGLTQRARQLVKDGVDIRYGCDVQGLEDMGKDGVCVHYTQTADIGQQPVKTKETFASVHVRTGSLSTPRKPSFPGIEKYKGRWCMGVSNGLEAMPVKGNNVLVIGMGAFAIENAKRAIELGAKKVTLLSRSGNVVCPRYLIYHGATSVLQLSNMFIKKELDIDASGVIFGNAHRLPTRSAERGRPNQSL